MYRIIRIGIFLGGEICMSSTAYNDALNRIFDKNKEIFEVFDELMESIQNVKDIVEGSEEVAYEIQDIPLETYVGGMTADQQLRFKQEAIICEDWDLKLTSFGEFYEKRKELLTQRLLEILE